MPFQPINSDHAIQLVQFGVVLNKAVTIAAVDKLCAEAASWRADLPAIEIPQILDVRVDPATGVPKPVVTKGAEFSVKRPDGTPVTSLTIINNEVVVLTTRYTRWQPIWEKVQSYLLDALRRIATLEKSRGITIQSATLVFVDAFRSTDPSPNFEEVLAKSIDIPHSLFDHGPHWHCHTGWFAPIDKGRILNQVNIDSKSAKVMDTVSGESTEPLELSITHRQVREFTPELSLGEVVSEEHCSNIIDAFEVMHVANKQRVSGLLTASMRDRIRIEL
jgi:hypothetical protein